MEWKDLLAIKLGEDAIIEGETTVSGKVTRNGVDLYVLPRIKYKYRIRCAGKTFQDVVTGVAKRDLCVKTQTLIKENTAEYGLDWWRDELGEASHKTVTNSKKEEVDVYEAKEVLDVHLDDLIAEKVRTRKPKNPVKSADSIWEKATDEEREKIFASIMAKMEAEKAKKAEALAAAGQK